MGDVPWRWTDLLIGFAPLILARVLSAYLHVATLSEHWGYHGMGLTVLGQSWMFALTAGGRSLAGGVLLASPLASASSGDQGGAPGIVCTPGVTLGMSGAAALAGRVLADGRDATGGTLGRLVRGLEPGQTWLFVVLAVLGAPVVEEIFFRGMLFNALRQRMPLVLAVLIQGGVFGLVHPFGLASSVGIGVGGVVFALLYRRRRTLLSPILLHGMVNALGVALLLSWLAADASAPRLGVVGEAGPGGCRVTVVAPGSGAEAAGLRPGDVITAVDGIHVFDLRTLTIAVREHRVGESAVVEYRRGDEPHRVEIRLKKLDPRSPVQDGRP